MRGWLQGVISGRRRSDEHGVAPGGRTQTDGAFPAGARRGDGLGKGLSRDRRRLSCSPSSGFCEESVAESAGARRVLPS